MKPDACDFLDEESKKYLEDLIIKLMQGRVIPFIGAGLSRNARRKDGSSKKFPLWGDLIKNMLNKLYRGDKEKIEKEKYYYEKVADKYEAVFGRNNLLQFLVNSLEDMEFEPGKIHRLIGQFDWDIITTNFDTLIERAFESVRNEKNVIYRDEDLTIKGEPRIYKMNGCIENDLEGIIITSEDFRTFGDKKPFIELYVKKCFIESTVLFIGFSLNDPAINMIHGWVQDRLISKRANRFDYSIQVSIDELEEQVWNARGIRFIKLSHDRRISDDEIEERIFEILNYLYNSQLKAKARRKTIGELIYEEKSPDPSSFRECLDKIKKKVGEFEKSCEMKSSYAQLEIQEKILDCLNDDKIDFLGLLKTLWDSNDLKLGKDFIALLRKLCPETVDNILNWTLKKILEESEKSEGEIFLDNKLTESIRKISETFFIESRTGNPDLWIMAMYLAVRMGISQKLLPIEFFKNGFLKIQEYVSLEKNKDRMIAKELHHYWLMVVLWIGPLQNGIQMLDICRKMPPYNCIIDISEYIHYHIETFLDDRSKHLDLFLRALHKLSSSNDQEGFYKFLLLNSFLAEYKVKGFNDLFLETVYDDLFAKFREIYYQRTNASAIVGTLKIDNLKSLILSIFTGTEQGQSLLSTGIADPFLNSSPCDIAADNLNTIK